MIDQLKSLAVFAYVVQEGSFRAAASRLQLSPSVISHHVNLLENQLSVVLFYRSTRAITLTDDGKRLYESATHMVSAAENSLGLYSDSADQRLLDLRVAIPNMLNGHPVFERIIEFAKKNPGIKLNLNSSDVALNLISENIDVAIRIGKLKDSDFKARKIGQDRRVIVASPALIKRHAKLTHPDQLSTWDCISFSSVPDSFTFRKGRSTAEVWGNTAAVTDSLSTVRELCIAGIGVAGLTYESAKIHIKKKQLLELLPEWNTQALDVYVMWAKNADIKKHTRQFINALAQAD